MVCLPSDYQMDLEHLSKYHVPQKKKSSRFGRTRGRANDETSFKPFPASLKTARSSRMSLSPPALCVRLYVPFAVFLYTICLLLLSLLSFQRFSFSLFLFKASPLSGNKPLPSFLPSRSLCLSFPSFLLCRTNLCVCFRLTLFLSD